jgi:hypothetical protein
VLAPGGWLLLQVPYATCTERNLVNPYHRQLFNEFSFDFFDPDVVRRRPDRGVAFARVFHDLVYFEEFAGKDPGQLEWDRRHLLNVAKAIDFGLVAWEDGRASPVVDEALRQAQRARLAECIAARREYDDGEAR